LPVEGFRLQVASRYPAFSWTARESMNKSRRLLIVVSSSDKIVPTRQ